MIAGFPPGESAFKVRGAGIHHRDELDVSLQAEGYADRPEQQVNVIAVGAAVDLSKIVDFG